MPYEDVNDRLPFLEYLALAKQTSHEIYRVLKPGGRAWVNVPPAMPSQRDGARINLEALWHRALKVGGLLFRDTVIWLQGGHDAGCAWGSLHSPNAPNLRGGYECVLLFFKGTWRRSDGLTTREGGKNDVPREDWPHLTRNVWKFNSQRRDGHPAPFPDELPRRAILLSTWRGGTVLDPFAGSGTTERVATELGRVGIGVELSEGYCRKMNEPRSLTVWDQKRGRAA